MSVSRQTKAKLNQRCLNRRRAHRPVGGTTLIQYGGILHNILESIQFKLVGICIRLIKLNYLKSEVNIILAPQAPQYLSCEGSFPLYLEGC